MNKLAYMYLKYLKNKFGVFRFLFGYEKIDSLEKCHECGILLVKLLFSRRLFKNKLKTFSNYQFCFGEKFGNTHLRELIETIADVLNHTSFRCYINFCYYSD